MAIGGAEELGHRADDPHAIPHRDQTPVENRHHSPILLVTDEASGALGHHHRRIWEINLAEG